MRECAERLRPDDTEVSNSAVVQLSKAAVEDIGQDVHSHTSHDGLTTPIEMVRNVAEGERHRDLQEETDGSQCVAGKSSEAKTTDKGRRIGIEGTLRSVVAQRNENVHPHAPAGQLEMNVSDGIAAGALVSTYSFLECRTADPLLLSALHGIVEQHTAVEDMNLSVSEDFPLWQERAVWVLERVGQEETKDHAAENGEETHEREEPEPARLPANATHMKDAIRQQLRRSLTKLITEVENHDTLCGLLSREPLPLVRICGSCRGQGTYCGKGPQTTWDEAGLSHTQEKATSNEGAIVVLERLEGADSAEEEQLQRQPLAGANTIEDHVRWDLEEDDTQRQHLLADVELVLVDADVLHHVVRDGIGDVSTVQLQTEEAERQEGHDEKVKPAKVSRVSRQDRASTYLRFAFASSSIVQSRWTVRPTASSLGGA